MRKNKFHPEQHFSANNENQDFLLTISSEFPCINQTELKHSIKRELTMTFTTVSSNQETKVPNMSFLRLIVFEIFEFQSLKIISAYKIFNLKSLLKLSVIKVPNVKMVFAKH